MIFTHSNIIFVFKSYLLCKSVSKYKQFIKIKIMAHYNNKSIYKWSKTDISSLFDEIETRYSNRNVGAIILTLSDVKTGLEPLLYNPSVAKIIRLFPLSLKFFLAVL